MKINLNYKVIEVACNLTIRELISIQQLLNINLIVVNGVIKNDDYKICKNDDVLAIDTRTLNDGELIKRAIYARNNSYLVDRLATLKVVVLGCGGIGSNVARMLVQSGIENISLIDFDIVDPTNLNRQFYSIGQIGKSKVECLAQNLEAINPNVKINKYYQKLDINNIDSYTSGYDFVIEAFDNPLMKAMVTNCIGWHGSYLILANGMAGIKPARELQTKQIANKVYMCGDGYSSVQPHIGLMAPQVTLVASQMVNKILEIVNEQEKNENR